MAKEFLSTSVKFPEGLSSKIDEIFAARGKEAEKHVGNILLTRTRHELISRGHYAEKDLVGSLKIELSGAATNHIVSLVTLDIAANALEYGTNPVRGSGSGIGETTVNVENILAWVKAKHITPRYGDIRSFAFAVARNIARKGMTLKGQVIKNAPKRPFNAAQKKAKREIDKYWETMVATIVRDLTNKLS